MTLNYLFNLIVIWIFMTCPAVKEWQGPSVPCIILKGLLQHEYILENSLMECSCPWQDILEKENSTYKGYNSSISIFASRSELGANSLFLRTTELKLCPDAVETLWILSWPKECSSWPASAGISTRPATRATLHHCIQQCAQSSTSTRNMIKPPLQDLKLTPLPYSFIS